MAGLRGDVKNGRDGHGRQSTEFSRCKQWQFGKQVGGYGHGQAWHTFLDDRDAAARGNSPKLRDQRRIGCRQCRWLLTARQAKDRGAACIATAACSPRASDDPGIDDRKGETG